MNPQGGNLNGSLTMNGGEFAILFAQLDLPFFEGQEYHELLKLLEKVHRGSLGLIQGCQNGLTNMERMLLQAEIPKKDSPLIETKYGRIYKEDERLCVEIDKYSVLLFIVIHQYKEHWPELKRALEDRLTGLNNYPKQQRSVLNDEPNHMLFTVARVQKAADSLPKLLDKLNSDIIEDLVQTILEDVCADWGNW